MAREKEEEKKKLPSPDMCFDLVPTKGRPRKVLNNVGILLIEALAARFCSQDEIAAYLNVDFKTLHSKANEKTFYTAYNKGKENGKTTLRSYQFALAQKNATMAIFLGKNYLGQSDEPQNKDDYEDLKPLAEMLKED